MTTTADRSRWGHGPWDNEPDSLDWVSEYGLACRMRRNRAGAWCGYVAVPSSHPWFGKSYQDNVPASPELLNRLTSTDRVGVFNLVGAMVDDDCPEGHARVGVLVDVHGGLTWAEWLPGGRDGERDGQWWFGFDCSHDGDANPTRGTSGLDLGAVYRDAVYVQRETNGLARQLWLVGAPHDPTTKEPTT